MVPVLPTNQKLGRSNRRGSALRRRAIVLGLVVLPVITITAWWRTRLPTAPPQLAHARPPTLGPPSVAGPEARAAKDRPSGMVGNDEPSVRDPLAVVDERASAWAKVDLDEIRAAMPDNLYWKMAAPTTDPAVLREREEERARWNGEYGKVLSNTATAEEIDAYYANQQRLSTDYLEFLLYLRSNYAEVIPEQDVGLLKLAGEMHLARLEEIPRKIAEAHERREAHDAARRAWLDEQKAFEGEPSDEGKSSDAR